MTSVAHLNQPRDNGKFSFKASPEAENVRLGTAGPAAVDRPALDGMIHSYAAGLTKGSAQDRARAAATLDLLQEAAKSTGTEHEALGHLRRRHSAAIEGAFHAKNQKVAPLDIAGLVRRRRAVRAANAHLEAAGWTHSLLQHEMNIGRRGRRA
ncbi:MAG TPA: hypothetical protein VF885_11625 [Arthrobacter sp.]